MEKQDIYKKYQRKEKVFNDKVFFKNEHLNVLEEHRVFEIYKYIDDGSLYIVELCDEEFGFELSKEHCLGLSKLFKALAKEARTEKQIFSTQTTKGE